MNDKSAQPTEEFVQQAVAQILCAKKSTSISHNNCADAVCTIVMKH
jgi:hypothetical protein